MCLTEMTISRLNTNLMLTEKNFWISIFFFANNRAVSDFFSSSQQKAFNAYFEQMQLQYLELYVIQFWKVLFLLIVNAHFFCTFIQFLTSLKIASAYSKLLFPHITSIDDELIKINLNFIALILLFVDVPLLKSNALK